MSEQLVGEIENLGVRAAEIIRLHPQPLNGFVHAYRRPRDFRKWLEKAAVTWLTWRRETKQTEPFVSPRLMRALFEYSDEAWLNRQTLFVAVLGELQAHGFAPEPEDAEQAADAIETEPSDNNDEEQQ